MGNCKNSMKNNWFLACFRPEKSLKPNTESERNIFFNRTTSIPSPNDQKNTDPCPDDANDDGRKSPRRRRFRRFFDRIISSAASPLVRILKFRWLILRHFPQFQSLILIRAFYLWSGIIYIYFRLILVIYSYNYSPRKSETRDPEKKRTIILQNSIRYSTLRAKRNQNHYYRQNHSAFSLVIPLSFHNRHWTLILPDPRRVLLLLFLQYLQPREKNRRVWTKTAVFESWRSMRRRKTGIVRVLKGELDFTFC